jgi:menaquinone-dependent protoporphyrinogen oxidase
MAEILIAYSTTDGHTKRIGSHLQQVIERAGHRVTLASLDDDAGMDLTPFDKVVIGASIRYGRHKRSVYAFIERNQALLDCRPNAFFSVNVVARKPAKASAQTNPYVRKFLAEIPWRPKAVAVFAGKIDYPRYSRRDRLIIRLIMWLTHGPTDPNAVVEFTDWQRVDDFGRLVAGM